MCACCEGACSDLVGLADGSALCTEQQQSYPWKLPGRRRAVAQGLAAMLRLDRERLEVVHPRSLRFLPAGVRGQPVRAQRAVHAQHQVTVAGAHLERV